MFHSMGKACLRERKHGTQTTPFLPDISGCHVYACVDMRFRYASNP